MPERTSPKDDLTSADLTAADALDPYFYNSTLLWPATSAALVYALNRGRRMVTGNQLPPLPADVHSDGAAMTRWQAEVHAALERLGVFDAYRAHLVSTAYAVSCPWWCAGNHPLVISEDTGSVIHLSSPVAGIDFSNKTGLHDASSWMLYLTQVEPVTIDGSDDDDYEITVSGGLGAALPEEMDLEDLQCVATAYRQAADRVAQILAATNGSAAA